MSNPGVAGAEGESKLRLSYFNFYPGNHFDLHSFYMSYDSYFPILHGGAGIWVSDDYLGGIINDIRSGLAYSYFLQAGKELFIYAGLSASIFHRGFNFSKAILPDQIDPLGGVSLNSSETLAILGESVFDPGTGFFFSYKNMTGGFAIEHLSQPFLARKGNQEDRLLRKVFVHFDGYIPLKKKDDLRIRPAGFLEFQKGFFSAGGGAAMETGNISVNVILSADNAGRVNSQTGFSFMAGGFGLFYNYRFNLMRGNSMLPFSLLHQAGFSLSLNNVEKRNNGGTITFPKM
jgi:type IX secretion system PorP/SprF family membrane protein